MRNDGTGSQRLACRFKKWLGGSGDLMTRKINGQEKRCQCGSLEHISITSKEFLIGISYQNAKKGLGDGSFSTRVKEGSKICISRIRENLLYARVVIDEWWVQWVMTGLDQIDWRVGSKMSFRGRYSDEEWWDWLTTLGVSVQKWLGGSGDLMKNKVLAHGAWPVGLKMYWRGS